MALTDNCDVFGAAHEDGFNQIARHLMLQRPSLFNYATARFRNNPELLCKEIPTHPEVSRRGNTLLSVEDPLPLLGTDGLLGMDFCFQVADLKIDFHAGNQFALPAEIGVLPAQHLALHVQVCGGIACPDPQVADRYGELIAKRQRDDVAGKEPKRDPDQPRPPLQPVPGRKLECFCLDLFATAHTEWVGPINARELAVRLGRLEIVDIKPEGLENSLECYIATTLRVGILPRIRIALDTMVFELGKFATLSVSATPISAVVSNNPAIEDDHIKAFVNLGVAP